MQGACYALLCIITGGHLQSTPHGSPRTHLAPRSFGNQEQPRIHGMASTRPSPYHVEAAFRWGVRSLPGCARRRPRGRNNTRDNCATRRLAIDYVLPPTHTGSTTSP